MNVCTDRYTSIYMLIPAPAQCSGLLPSTCPSLTGRDLYPVTSKIFIHLVLANTESSLRIANFYPVKSLFVYGSIVFNLRASSQNTLEVTWVS